MEGIDSSKSFQRSLADEVRPYPAFFCLLLFILGGWSLSLPSGTGWILAPLLFSLLLRRPALWWLPLALLLGQLSLERDSLRTDFWEDFFKRSGFATLHLRWESDVYLKRDSEGRSCGWATVSPLDENGQPRPEFSRRFWVRLKHALPLRDLTKGTCFVARTLSDGRAFPRSLLCAQGLQPPNTSRNAFWNLRARLLERFERSLSERPAAGHPGLVRALLSGNRDGLDELLLNDFGRLGLLHLLALSGLHVALIFTFVRFLLGLFFQNTSRNAFVALLLVLAYGLFGGWAHSLFRSAMLCLI
ncbi:MAG: ComEC/Rec2 family competence protein, partial [Planctomycetes bacterium]|nr:ComEC/Rec2 family competence protein [Planctomycetota bacterium]